MHENPYQALISSIHECHEYEGVRWESLLGFNKPYFESQLLKNIKLSDSSLEAAAITTKRLKFATNHSDNFVMVLKPHMANSH